MMCIETVDYSVLVNQESVGPIIPGRGLRQGDPLSPYLFILCAEGLSALIHQAEARGELHGAKICRNAPIISHLLFADDCFLFFRASEEEAHKMKSILNMYEAASGQAISLPKSEIYYSRNVDSNIQNVITSTLGVQAVLGTGKYLGLPSMIGRNKQATFSYIKDRVWQKISSWSSKCLSKAGREVMIKSVLQAIPSYVMSIFLLPSNLIDSIEKMINGFWWGNGGSSSRGIHWLSWDKLTVHKTKGGMGFRDLTAFNLAMLGKQGWKFQTQPECLVTKLFKARYFPRNEYIDAELGHNPSFVWRSIFSARRIVRSGARWKIGNGINIPIFEAPWLSNGGCISGVGQSSDVIQHSRVNSLIDHNNGIWNYPLISDYFDQTVVQNILRTPIFRQVEEYQLI
jgi:hypothetical protein